MTNTNALKSRRGFLRSISAILAALLLPVAWITGCKRGDGWSFDRQKNRWVWTAYPHSVALSEVEIQRWARKIYVETGAWPKPGNFGVLTKGSSWMTIDWSLRKGARSLNSGLYFPEIVE